jgi:hypothetical protein
MNSGEILPRQMEMGVGLLKTRMCATTYRR